MLFLRLCCVQDCGFCPFFFFFLADVHVVCCVCIRLFVLLAFVSPDDAYNSTTKNACDSACIASQHLCPFYGVSPSFLVELGITITTQEWPFAPCLSSPRWLNKLCFFSLSLTHEHTYTHTHAAVNLRCAHFSPLQFRFLQHSNAKTLSRHKQRSMTVPLWPTYYLSMWLYHIVCPYWSLSCDDLSCNWL